ncbi:MAG TPA: hypothetical protein VMV47_16220 [Bacteroidales bacterium]|nr:hypothetical protein [Bacteroidales bacterium]
MTSLINKLRFVVVIFYITSQILFSQDEEININALKDIRYTEELLVQSDRDIYIVGERVFLKIFKLNGITRTPGNVSQIVYIELLDVSGNPITQLKIRVNGPSGSCELRLPETLQTGSYLIRSCTLWMQNFSSDLFSYKRISVINPFETVSKIKLPSTAQQPDTVAFYPESGSLVLGVESLIGFRCFDKSGDPSGISGYVVDSRNDTLCKVKSDSEGYGLFSIKPRNNEKIYLIAGENRKNTRKFLLPAVKDSAIVFSVNTEPDKDFFRIEIGSNEKIDYAGRRLFLIYSQVNAIDVKKEITIDSRSEILLQKERLPAGLASIKIIDENGFPLGERWVYNEKRRAVNFNVKLDNSNYSVREKVKIGISATDSDGKPVKSDLMISVAKSFSYDKTNCSNVPGYRQLPVLATLAADPQHYDINDYLIFYKEEPIHKNYKSDHDLISAYLPELRGHLVTGRIRNTRTGESISNENVVLSFVGEKANCRFSKTDSVGHFNFVINDYGTREIVIQPLSPAVTDYIIELDNPFPDVSKKYRAFPFYPDSSMLDEINKAIISMQVQNIYEPYKKHKSLMAVHEERDFYGEPDDTILVSRYIELVSLKEVIKEIVPWVSIYKRSGQSKCKIISGPLSLPFESDPLMLVDGVPVNDLDKILTIDPQDLHRIEILKERYLISDIIIEGIIHFITYKHNLSSLEFEKPYFRREFEALQPVSSYNLPDYSNDTLFRSRIPDFRNTLYWNPYLTTGDTGKAEVEFYTSDEPGEFTIIVEGITTDGRTGRTEMTFIVEQGKIP